MKSVKSVLFCLQLHTGNSLLHSSNSCILIHISLYDFFLFLFHTLLESIPGQVIRYKMGGIMLPFSKCFNTIYWILYIFPLCTVQAKVLNLVVWSSLNNFQIVQIAFPSSSSCFNTSDYHFIQKVGRGTDLPLCESREGRRPW